MEETTITEHPVSEKEYDYHDQDSKVVMAWEYLDSLPDLTIVDVAEYARDRAEEETVRKLNDLKKMIIPDLQDFAKRNCAIMRVSDYGAALHVEITLDYSFVLDSDDTVTRTAIMMAKGICVERHKTSAEKIRIELDYE